MEKLKVEYVPIGSIQPYANNAKLHPAEQIEQIKKSIEEFGFNDPIAVWHDTIVEGHGRLIAATEMGLETVPIIRLDDLTDEQRRAYTLVHNKLTMNSDFDVDLLDFELDNLPEFDAEFYGFNLLDDDEEQMEIVEDETPEPPQEPKTKVGDLFLLGKHRLICGDSTDIAVIDRLMDGSRADIAITSPPYGAKNAAKIRGHYARGAKTNDSFYNEYEDDSDGWIDLIQSTYEVMAINTNAQFINIQMLADNKRQLIKFIYDNMEMLCDVIVWDKKAAPPQMQKNVLNNQYEFVFVFGKSSRTIPFANFHENYSNIIEQTTGNNEYANIHRAVYPVGLPAKIMEIASKAGSVLDVFGGTGTTMIACEQLNKKCYMCELDPRYCDVIIERWENLTGGKAVKIAGD